MLVFNEAQQLPRGLGFFDNRVADVGPVKAADKMPRVFELEPLDHVLSGQRIRRRRQGHARHVGEHLMQQAQAAVLGPKVVAPLAHAVRLVNRKQAEFAALIERAQQVFHTWRVDALGRSVQQRQLSALQLLFKCTAFFKTLRGV